MNLVMTTVLLKFISFSSYLKDLGDNEIQITLFHNAQKSPIRNISAKI